MILNFIIFASDKYKKQANILINSIEDFHPDGNITLYDLGDNNSPYILTLAKTRLEKTLELLEGGMENVVVLGADCELFDRLTEVQRLLFNGYDILLSPHITEWVPEDGLSPSNRDFYSTGHCNADFMVFNNTENTKKILKELIKLPMHDDKRNGIFFEQTWLSALPFMYDNIAIIHHSGYNVGYYNIHQREFRKENGKYFTKNGPLALMQYSGFDKSILPNKMSKFQTRYIAEGDILSVFQDYANKIR